MVTDILEISTDFKPQRSKAIRKKLPELVFSNSANIHIKVHITGKNLTVLARKK
jgi:hypothetical protein